MDNVALKLIESGALMESRRRSFPFAMHQQCICWQHGHGCCTRILNCLPVCFFPRGLLQQYCLPAFSHCPPPTHRQQRWSVFLPAAVRLLHKVAFNSKPGRPSSANEMHILRSELAAYMAASGAGGYARDGMKVQLRSSLWGNTAKKGDTRFQLKL